MIRSIYTLSKLHGIDINSKEQQRLNASPLELLPTQNRNSSISHRRIKTDNTKWQHVGQGRLCNKALAIKDKTIMEKGKLLRRVPTKVNLLRSSLENKQNSHAFSAYKNEHYQDNTSLDERLMKLKNHNNYGTVVGAAVLSQSKKINGILKKELHQDNKKKRRPTQEFRKQTFPPNTLISTTGQRNAKPKTTDAVSLYQYYKRGWNHWRIPGESPSYPTEWEIR